MTKNGFGKNDESVKKSSDPEIEIELNQVFAKWNENEVYDTLSDISFRVKKNQLCALIGPVGSGKVLIGFNNTIYCSSS